MLYAVFCRDKPGALKQRQDTRAAHLADIEATGIVAMAGPLLEAGQICGSLIVLDTGSLEAVPQSAAGDPDVAAGLFDSVSVTEWQKVIG